MSQIMTKVNSRDFIFVESSQNEIEWQKIYGWKVIEYENKHNGII